MPIVRSKRLVIVVSVIVVSIVSNLNFQIVTSSDDDEYLISEFSKRQDYDLIRVERLEARVSHLIEDLERFKKLTQDCQCNEITNNKNSHERRTHPMGLLAGDGHQHNHHRRHTDLAAGAMMTAASGPPLPPATGSDGSPSIRRRSRALLYDTPPPVPVSVSDRQANFLRGEPGRNGLDGVPGLDGAPGLDGVPGMDGRNGRDGADGRAGKDGKDGMAGDRGPIGPPGPPGEPGKRGKPGPAGKTGAPGQPGVCAYKAKYDCSSGGVQASNGSVGNGGLLLAPTMIGQVRGNGGGGGDVNGDGGDSIAPSQDERQVTVNEGDNIQLSCEAFGLPKPDYIWHRTTINNIKSTILIDVVQDLQVTSYPGSQLPLFGVDRVQSGNYECTASNGVPPPAIKRINLDVNYAPTVRLYPGPSIHKVKLGSSLFVECIVDANPSPFTYWMFGTELIMSIAASQVTTGGGASAEPAPTLIANSKLKKYTITESTGQLSTGAYYTIVTLNVANIQLDDLGLYKCVSKNLIGQTVGYLSLESLDGDDQPLLMSSSSSLSSSLVDTTSSNSSEQSKFRDIILERGSSYERFGHTLGWPTYLMERDPANYSIFDNTNGHHQRRQDLNPDVKRSMMMALNGFGLAPNRKVLLESELIHGQNETDPIKRGGGGGSSSSNENGHIERSQVGKSDSANTTTATSASNHRQTPDELHNGAGDQGGGSGVPEEDGLVNEIELCRVESNLAKNLPETEESPARTATTTAAHRPSVLLLDQVGKPVYVGSITSGLLNWWSMDSKFRLEDGGNGEATTNDISFSLRIYATSPNKTNTLYEYKSLPDLLKDQQMAIGTLSLGSESSNQYSLQYPVVGNSNLIYGRQFIYVTRKQQTDSASNSGGPKSASVGSLNDLMVVVLDLSNGNITHLKLENKIWRDLENQPSDLGPEYKLNRLELASDENGIWLIVPTFESLVDRVQDVGKRKSNSASVGKQFIRRLHVFKLDCYKGPSGQTEIQIDYHVSMKLDWRMMGQLFVIDGVLYGIKDRNLYSSKLQFAYDLYKCKLLSTDYLNEPHRTFTNHFGNTQMIKYNPNEPKRLYTIDNGNLLWCPVKLIQI